MAIELFAKDKNYSPMAIKSMANGETTPSKWLVACAIEILLHEKQDVLNSMLTTDDMFMLWVKPLLDHQSDKEQLLMKVRRFNYPELSNKICAYKTV